MNFIIYLQIGRGETESRSNQEAAVRNVGPPTIVLPPHVWVPTPSVVTPLSEPRNYYDMTLTTQRSSTSKIKKFKEGNSSTVIL